MCGDGCDGGYPISAWRYFVHTGVVIEEVALPVVRNRSHFDLNVVRTSGYFRSQISNCI